MGAPPRLLVVVAGVSGTGKTALGTALGRRLRLPFVDGDDLHAPEAVAGMRRGRPLDDAERAPWLQRVGATLADVERRPEGVAVACSALKAAYRRTLRDAAPGVAFLLLEAPHEVLERRLTDRPDHFMPAILLNSQLDALQPPCPAETDMTVLQADVPMPELVDAALAALRSHSGRGD